MTDPRDGPAWDEDAAADLIGRRVLLGVTYAQPGGDRHEQAHRRVLSADRRGIAIRLEGQRAGEVFRLPPDLRSFRRAPPGEYRLKSSGEVVVDPDCLCTWTIHPRQQ